MRIEKNIPAPIFLGSSKWAWLEDMEVGDSVVDKNARVVSTGCSLLYNSLKRIARKNGWVILGQKDSEGGIRIWRIK